MKTDFAIRVSNVSKKYRLNHPVKNVDGVYTNEHWALQDISFEIKNGESIGIIGPNGSGKSTLLKILSGITKPTSGEVEISGRVASILDIGAGFHPELSGRENVFLNGQLLGFSKKEIQNKYTEIVEFSGIGNFINEPVKNYSSGMYLRLAFSILAHLDFDIYLFDEVISVGDASFVRKIKNKLDSISNLNKTIVKVSHNLNELIDCNYIIEMSNAKIKRIGHTNQILNSYNENSIIESKNEITTTKYKYVLTDNTNELSTSLISIEIDQSENPSNVLNTKYDTNIKLNYKTINNNFTIEPLLYISDINGVIIFTTSPLLSGIAINDKSSGEYHAECNIPKSLLVGRLYVISLVFLKDVSKRKESNPQHKLVESISIDNSNLDVDSSFFNILTFKPIYCIELNQDKIELEIQHGMITPNCTWMIQKNN